MSFNIQTALMLLPYAWDTYNASLPDSTYQRGVSDLRGNIQERFDRQAWAESHGYVLIEDPTRTVLNERYRGVIAETPDAVIVAFRGTDFGDMRDVGINIDLSESPEWEAPFDRWTIGTHQVYAHQKCLAIYRGLQACVRNTVRSLFQAASGRKLYVTGHSLGGQLATLCALDLGAYFSPHDTVPLSRLWTFGSPRVGDQDLANTVPELTYESWRVRQIGDAIPYIPTIGARGRTRYMHVATEVNLLTNEWFPFSHKLQSYYRGCQQMIEVHSQSVFDPSAPITDLKVRIKTRDTLGAGTDNDVYVEVLDRSWGPLDSPGDDFERGSTHMYDLYEMFPGTKPSPPLQIRDLDGRVRLRMRSGPFYFSMFNGTWKPEWLELIVNDSIVGRKYFEGPFDWSISEESTFKFQLPWTTIFATKEQIGA